MRSNDNPVIEQQKRQIIGLQSELSIAHQQLHWQKLIIQKLEEALRQERIARYGPRSETLSALQLKLLDEEPSVTADEVAAEAARESEPASQPEAGQQTTANKPERKSHPGRRPLPKNLPRKTETIICAPEACQCRSCGRETTVIGHDESEVLDVEPANYFVRLIRREKRACRHCENRSVVSAPLEDRIIEKGLASNQLVVDVLVKKYCDHLPLYRQEAGLLRDAGVAISRATMDGWLMHSGGLLVPVCEGMRTDLLTSTYLQADETTVDVQTRDKSGKNHQAYLWQFGKPGGEVVFIFALGRGGGTPETFLKNWEGKLQTDAYQGYNHAGGPGLIHYGCWSHGRRYFIDAVKVNPADGDAGKMVDLIDALFLIERTAKANGLSGDALLDCRIQHGQEFLDRIHAHLQSLQHRTLPKSKLGEGVTYLLNQWEPLRRAFLDPEVELSNNLAENSMRPLALGRKNWLHIGSVKAGPKVAAIASVVESCRRLNIPVRDYLLGVLPGLDRKTRAQAALLTPARWAAQRGR